MLEILKQIPFFGKLNDEVLNKISETVQMEYFPAEHTIFGQGDVGEKMYVIKSGKVQVIRDEKLVTELENNSFFGEMALVSDEVRNATIKAVTDVELLTLDKNDFKRLMETEGSIAEIVSYEVVKRSNEIF